MTKIINFCGAPSAGKSTSAAMLFATMKNQGYNVELVSEYAKELAWEEADNIIKDQFFVAAQQNRRLERLRGKVDYVITDSPLFLADIYKPDDYPPSFSLFLADMFDSYDNYLVYVHRGTAKFNPDGRFHHENETIALDAIIKSYMHFLVDKNVTPPFLEFYRNEFDPQAVIEDLENGNGSTRA